MKIIESMKGFRYHKECEYCYKPKNCKYRAKPYQFAKNEHKNLLACGCLYFAPAEIVSKEKHHQAYI